MRRAVWLISILALCLGAEEIRWTSSYDVAMQMAKKENKPVLMLMTTVNCRWCKKLKAVTLKDEKVSAYINRHYVPIAIDRDLDKYPEKHFSVYVPATHLIDPNGRSIISPVVGYWGPDDFMSDLTLAINKLKRRSKSQ